MWDRKVNTFIYFLGHIITIKGGELDVRRNKTKNSKCNGNIRY